jgi:hypothetical protein
MSNTPSPTIAVQFRELLETVNPDDGSAPEQRKALVHLLVQMGNDAYDDFIVELKCLSETGKRMHMLEADLLVA